MELHRAFFGIAAGVIFLAVVGCLSGCGNDSTLAAAGSLAVADSNNNRVLVYNPPNGTDASASLVLGQTGFTNLALHPCPAIGANTLCNPADIARDAAGNIYIADVNNNRVLGFQPPFTNGMSADLVIGQSVFTSNTFLGGVQATASGMAWPVAATVDGNGNLWVSDIQNSRVLEFVPPFSNGMSATLALGQTSTGATADLACNQGGPWLPPSASTLCGPQKVAFDAQGNLWVADCNNHRVLEYNPPFSTGMAASLELGQPAAAAFTSGTVNNGGVSASSLNCPVSLAFDSSGDLWVADQFNNRVLEFVPPFSNGIAAAVVLGQSDFTHGDRNRGANEAAANTMSGPAGLNFDSAGNLSVADSGNSRVLTFAPSFHNGMSAARVLGQPSFAGSQSNQGSGFPAANTLSYPSGILAF